MTAGAEVNARDEAQTRLWRPRGWEESYTPLHYAAQYNENPGVIELLLEAGAEVDAGEGGETPLHYAAQYNENPSVIEVLIAAGTWVNARDDRLNTPLHHAAAYSDNLATVEALLVSLIFLARARRQGRFIRPFWSR